MVNPPTLSETDVRLAAAGDRAAYERLVRRCSGLVSAIALSVVRDVGRSEDIAQEVFIAAWKDLSRLRNPRTFLPWLRGMARNLALRTLRERHVPTDVSVLALGADERPGAVDTLEAAERDKALEAALMDLDTDDREVLLVYYREGHSLRQVASLLDLSEPAARKRLSRARARLRQGVEVRLDALAVETAPGPELAANVLLLLPAAVAPGAVATASLKGALSGSPLSVLGMPLLTLLGVLGAIAFSARKLEARARDEEERRGIRRYKSLSGALATVAILGMGVGTVLELHRDFFLALWVGYVAAWLAMTLGYLPRIIGRRLALERAEDPTAEARQRRERRFRLGAAAFVAGSTLINMAMILLAP
jgi:RNA polymerase sigma factor (sigma-70 family)